VRKREEKMEQSKRNKSIGRGDQGWQIDKEEGSWTTQQAKEDVNRCFEAPCMKEGKIGWRSLENMGQVT
jgi:hypothetical protein